MFDATTLVAFTFASIVLAAVPGPNITVIIATALQRGPMAGLAVVLGTQLGILSQIVVVAFGFDALVGFMAQAFDWLKLAGAAYLIYLGFTMLRSDAGSVTGKAVGHRSVFRLALRGFLVNWSNPKTLLFIGAFIPQFVGAGEPAFAQIMFLGLIFVGVTTLVDGAYGLLAGLAGRALSTGRVRTITRVSGAILMLGGAWLATQQKA